MTRHLRAVFAVMLLSVPVTAHAQAFLGAAPGAQNFGGARARSVNNNTGDRVYVGAIGDLGTAALRDSYIGTWTGTGSPRDFGFTMQWTGALLRFEFDQLTGIAAGSNNAATVISGLNAGGIELAQAGTFNAFRIFARDASASLIDLTLNGVDVLTGTGATVANAAAYWTADPSSPFIVRGTLRTAVCANDGCRFEVSVATVLPEPHTWAMLLAGTVMIVGVAQRRRRV